MVFIACDDLGPDVYLAQGEDERIEGGQQAGDSVAFDVIMGTEFIAGADR